jgi:RecG-like helicase
MKTPMQELIEELESIKDYKYKELTIRLVKEKLEKEKEQIMNAFLQGKVNKSKDWAIEYYNQTYNN